MEVVGVNKRRSISQGYSPDTRAIVAMRRARLKDVPYSELNPGFDNTAKPLQQMEILSGRKGGAIGWGLMGKSKNGMLDTILKNHMKDKKQAPNHYFKTEKGSQLDIKKFSTEHMFSTKKSLVS